MQPKRNFILADRLWAAWWLWLLGAIAFGILGSLHILPERSVSLLPFVLAPLSGLLALIGYVSGEAPARFGKIERSRSPIAFWIAISFYGFVAVALVAMGFIRK